jgi:hypothetical protein
LDTAKSRTNTPSQRGQRLGRSAALTVAATKETSWIVNLCGVLCIVIVAIGQRLQDLSNFFADDRVNLRLIALRRQDVAEPIGEIQQAFANATPCLKHGVLDACAGCAGRFETAYD